MFRITFAVLVIFGHIYGASHDPFLALGTPLSWGAASVDAFFLLSGYLIVESWLRFPRWSVYFPKRLLRIVPGYAVAACLSICVIGCLAPGVPHFFRSALSLRTFGTLALLSAPAVPPTFPRLGFAVGVNTPMWTINYEMRCYLLVAVLGTVGIFRRRYAWLCLTVAVFGVASAPSLMQSHAWRPGLLPGDAAIYARLIPAFMIGACFFLYKQYIPFHAVAAFAAVAAIGAARSLHASEPWYVLLFGYLIFFFADLTCGFWSHWWKVPDISYGMYLYGWPVQWCLLYFVTKRLALAFALTVVLSGLLGVFSWYLVERPMLRSKRGPRVAPAE